MNRYEDSLWAIQSDFELAFVWVVLILNLSAFILHLFVGGWGWIITNGTFTVYAGYRLYLYYKFKRSLK